MPGAIGPPLRENESTPGAGEGGNLLGGRLLDRHSGLEGSTAVLGHPHRRSEFSDYEQATPHYSDFGYYKQATLLHTDSSSYDPHNLM